MLEQVEVMCLGADKMDRPFGPLPGLRDANVVAYEFELPTRFEPWPGRDRVQRTFVPLDVGVSLANPVWVTATDGGGSVVNRSEQGEDCWYVDLISVDVGSGRYSFTGLFIDVEVPTDGRHFRMLDLDEFADAIDSGRLSRAEAVDGLRRWQRFLDRHLHADPWPTSSWSDFPPASIGGLEAVPSPIGPPVRWEE